MTPLRSAWGFIFQKMWKRRENMFVCYYGSRNNDDREWSEEKMFEHRIEELNEKNAEVIMERSDEKRTYTVDEIQDILSISRPTAYNLVKKNVFHSVRVGGHIRISKKSFDDWLDHQM